MASLKRMVPAWHGGGLVEVAWSRGSQVMALADYRENLFRDPSVPWPPPAITQKLFHGDRIWAFDKDEREILTRNLGYYTNLQSINSEDAITWSVFGTLASAPVDARVDFLNWVLEYLIAKGRLQGAFQPTMVLTNSWCSVDLWRRTPHPDTHGLNGPELDFILDGDRVLVFGESKWKSSEAKGQGKEKDKTQMQLRCEFLQWAERVYGPDRLLLALMVVRDERLVDRILKRLVATANTCAVGDLPRVMVGVLTWKELCYESNHPRADDLRMYYEWKSATPAGRL